MVDEDVVARILETGDKDLFRVLIERHQERVMRIAASVLGPFSRSAAEDAAQETFLKAFRGLIGFRGQARFSTWLFRIAYRQALDVRAARIPPPLGFVRDPACEPSAAPDPLAEVLKKELAAEVAAAVETLPDIYRTAINMHYWLDMSIDEIAEALDAPANTVKSYLFRARALLKGRLEGISAERPGSGT